MLDKLRDRSLVVIKDGNIIFESDKDRLRPIIMCINKQDIRGSIVLDKVVGLAAAKLFAFAKVKKVYAKIASKAAVNYLGGNIRAQKIVDNVMNDDMTEICPMERLAEKIDSKELFEKLNK
ncbi:DUF1893 domain-containing protein [Candidatus Woesearchaeota archaeon]|nr:DUF1893 domain-containing protein [Candidatus Woesearchaeota archaeon]